MPLKNSYWWFYDQLKIACYRNIAKFGYDLVDIQAVQFRRNVRYWVVVKSHCSIEPQLWYWGKPSAGSAYALFEPRIKKRQKLQFLVSFRAGPNFRCNRLLLCWTIFVFFIVRSFPFALSICLQPISLFLKWGSQKPKSSFFPWNQTCSCFQITIPLPYGWEFS